MDEELAARLAGAEVLWLTTVADGGRPQTSPVWFVWDGGDFHVATEPGAAKVANVRARPSVSAHLEGAGAGELVVTVEGEARLGDGLGDEVAARYAAKYAAGFERLGTTAPAYLQRFSTGIRVTPARWRVFRSE